LVPDGATTPKTSSTIAIPGTNPVDESARGRKLNRPPQSTSPAVLSESMIPAAANNVNTSGGAIKRLGEIGNRVGVSSPSEAAAAFKRARETSLDRQVTGRKENRGLFVPKRKVKKQKTESGSSMR
jgi:hypothetical protein